MVIKRYTCLCLLLLSCGTADAGPVVRVVGPDPVAGEVAGMLVHRLPAVSITRDDDAPARLVVAVGASAFLATVPASQSAGDALPAVVGIALTRHSYGQAPKGRHTALYWEPDPARQLRLARALLPGARRAGVLLGSANDALLAELRSESSRLGISLSVATVDGRMSKQLNRVLGDSDFLLGIDDPRVFAPELARTVLLTSYRHGKPVFGPTAAWVSAGSVASLSSSLVDVVDELAAWMPRLLADGELPVPRYLLRYHVATNPVVARSLQMSLPPTPALEALVRDEDSRP